MDIFIQSDNIVTNLDNQEHQEHQEHQENNTNDSNYESFKLLIDIFALFGYDFFETRNDFIDISLSYELLRDPKLIDKLYNQIPKLKTFYKSSKLTCLHKNSTSNQKFPGVNMVRQILKCNKLKLKPMIICKGYNKSTGKKIIERYYQIKDMES